MHGASAIASAACRRPPRPNALDPRRRANQASYSAEMPAYPARAPAPERERRSAAEVVVPQYTAAHPLGVPCLVNVLAYVALAGYTTDAAVAAGCCKASWLRDEQLRWALVKARHGEERHTRLHWACAEGRSARVAELLDWRSDIEARDAKDYTPLHFAGIYGHVEAARELLRRGARLEARNFEGATVLHAASGNGSLDVVRRGRRRRRGGLLGRLSGDCSSGVRRPLDTRPGDESRRSDKVDEGDPRQRNKRTAQLRRQLYVRRSAWRHLREDNRHYNGPRGVVPAQKGNLVRMGGARISRAAEHARRRRAAD